MNRNNNRLPTYLKGLVSLYVPRFYDQADQNMVVLFGFKMLNGDIGFGFVSYATAVLTYIVII